MVVVGFIVIMPFVSLYQLYCFLLLIIHKVIPARVVRVIHSYSYNIIYRDIGSNIPAGMDVSSRSDV
jgi:hypothetical protein